MTESVVQLKSRNACLLNAGKVDDFWVQGFVRVPRFIEPNEVVELGRIFATFFTQRAGRKKGNHYDLAGTDEESTKPVLPQLVNPSEHCPDLQNTQFWARARQVAVELLGPGCSLQNEHAILKPAGYGAETPWHQDEAYWAPDLEYESLSIWLPLQPVDEKNGCLRFVPGSHRGEVLEHRSLGNNVRIHGLEAVNQEHPDGVGCSLKTGGVTIHHCRTLHSSGANRTEASRYAYILGFGRPPGIRSYARDFSWKNARRTARDERRRQSGTKPTSDGRRMIMVETPAPTQING